MFCKTVVSKLITGRHFFWNWKFISSYRYPPPKSHDTFCPPICQQTRVYPYPLGVGSARPNPKMGAQDPENSLFLGFSVLRGGFRKGPDHGVGVDPETVNLRFPNQNKGKKRRRAPQILNGAAGWLASALDSLACYSFPLPSSQKQLQAKINENPRIWDFLSVELRKQKRKKMSGFLLLVSVACCCGLCVPNMTTTKANAKENLGEFVLPFHCKSESEIKSPDFHL